MIEDKKKLEEELNYTTYTEANLQNLNSNTPIKEVINLEQERIIDWLKKVKFKKQFIGGVDEQDVWKKINELNEMYEDALKAERIRYDVLLEAEKKKRDYISQKKEIKE